MVVSFDQDLVFRSLVLPVRLFLGLKDNYGAEKRKNVCPGGGVFLFNYVQTTPLRLFLGYRLRHEAHSNQRISADDFGLIQFATMVALRNLYLLRLPNDVRFNVNDRSAQDDWPFGCLLPESRIAVRTTWLVAFRASSVVHYKPARPSLCMYVCTLFLPRTFFSEERPGRGAKG